MTYTWAPLNVPAVNSDVLVERLVTAAQCELIENGILGFRTQNVAQRANCSISLIYRHFEDRDGLIVHALGEMFAKLQHEYVDGVNAYFASLDVVRATDIAAVIPHLDENARSRNMQWRMLALAVSMENPTLRTLLESAIAEVMPKWTTTLSMIAAKVPVNESVDMRVFPMVLGMNLPYYNSLLGEFRVRDNDFKAYIGELLTRPTR